MITCWAATDIGKVKSTVNDAEADTQMATRAEASLGMVKPSRF
jgi:hypothetical protein